MKSAVIDACVVASWFLPGEEGGAHLGVLDRLYRIKILVPAIFHYEFMNIIYMAEKRKRINHAVVSEILAVISQYPIVTESHIVEKGLIDLAQKHNLTAYDAAYLELSLRHGIPLITYDKALLAAAKKLHIKKTI